MSNYLSSRNCFDDIQYVGYTVILGNNLQLVDYTFAIPTYKRSIDLELAINSIYAQKTEIYYNILIVDNNPERDDETERLIMHKYSNRNNIQYIKNCENIGMAGNWNRLFALCKSKYLIMLHDDDCIYDNFLDYIDCLVTKIPNVCAINSKKKYWDGKNTAPIHFSSSPHNFIRHSIRTNLYSYEFKAPSGCLFDVARILDIGGFDINSYPSIDYTTILKLLLKDELLITTNDVLMLYRVSNNTSSKKETILKWIEFEYKLKKELSERLNLGKLHTRFVVNFTVKYWLYILNSLYGEKKSYNEVSHPGYVYIIFFIIFQYFYQYIYIGLFCKFKIQKNKNL